MTRIFVYGTLRKGGRNHHLLTESNCLAYGVIAWGYALYDNVAYPYAVKGSLADRFIVGELYMINEQTLAALDVLEGIAEGNYSREFDTKLNAYIYLSLNPETLLLPQIESGDWIAHATEHVSLSSLIPSGSMFYQYEQAEYQFAQRLINIALAHAAIAFEKLLKQRIRLHCASLYGSNNTHLLNQLPLPDGDNLLLYTTNVMGEISGISHLIFSVEDTSEIVKKCMPSAVGSREMTEALLAEIDNILSASVVTQLANMLGKHMLGLVPKMRLTNREGIIHLMQSDMNANGFCLLLSTTFVMDDLRLQPVFVWFFEDDFAVYLRQAAASESKRKIIEENEEKVKNFLIYEY
jgi:gamma-glutamylcyclotransferase (GGCT)/AIG2-like uncharacterized protein YtfP/chemotaxis protein CheY-P-specific phosphatase CheC